jgi:uncharacterized Fe-S radical SAM superfamily protein PflX
MHCSNLSVLDQDRYHELRWLVQMSPAQRAQLAEQRAERAEERARELDAENKRLSSQVLSLTSDVVRAQYHKQHVCSRTCGIHNRQQQMSYTTVHTGLFVHAQALGASAARMTRGINLSCDSDANSR